MRGVAWSHQRRVKEYIERTGRLPSPQQFYNMIEKNCRTNKYKALFSLMYLTAGRKSEILAIKRENIEIGIKKDRKCFIVRMPNRKHKKRKYKEIVIPMDNNIERSYIMNVINYADHFYEEESLFELTGPPVNKMCLKCFKFNPHLIRAIRLTHLVTAYGFNEQMLVQFAGWTDSRPAKEYMMLKGEDFLNYIRSDDDMEDL